MLSSGSESDATTGTSPLVIAFIVFQSIGLFCSIVIFASALFSPKTRQATWFNFIIILFINCFSYLLLPISGQLKNPRPPFNLCFAQACLIYGVPVLAIAGTGALVVQLLLNINFALSPRGDACRGVSWTTAAVATPYALFFAVILEVLIIGIKDSSTIQKLPEVAYCNLSNPVPGRVSAAIVTLLVVPIIAVAALICLRIRRNWTEFKKQRETVSMFFRLCSFTLLAIICALAGAMFFLVALLGGSEDGVATENLLLAIVPMMAIATFGTHMDLLRVWMFWRKKPTAPADSTTVEEFESFMDMTDPTKKSRALGGLEVIIKTRLAPSPSALP
ncbi:hypothetical protein PM082_007656 [Marasmius tenuissimus]|nr:hypothetical protein PM082_007656 [Marasmius tenuissimus]